MIIRFTHPAVWVQTVWAVTTAGRNVKGWIDYMKGKKLEFRKNNKEKR